MAQARKGTKVYVGNLNPATDERDLREVFEPFGVLSDLWIAKKPPGFGFVWFEEARAAEDAVRQIDGQEVGQQIIRVEISKGGDPDRGPRERGGPRYSNMPREREKEKERERAPRHFIPRDLPPRDMGVRDMEGRYVDYPRERVPRDLAPRDLNFSRERDQRDSRMHDLPPPRGPPPREYLGRSIPSDECYECGARGHMARDCPRRGNSSWVGNADFGGSRGDPGFRSHSPSQGFRGSAVRGGRLRSRSPLRRRSPPPPRSMYPIDRRMDNRGGDVRPMNDRGMMDRRLDDRSMLDRRLGDRPINDRRMDNRPPMGDRRLGGRPMCDRRMDNRPPMGDRRMDDRPPMGDRRMDDRPPMGERRIDDRPPMGDRRMDDRPMDDMSNHGRSMYDIPGDDLDRRDSISSPLGSI